MLIYTVEVDSPGAADVKARRLTVVVDGVQEQEVDLPGNCVKIGGLRFEEGCEVTLTLRDIDDAGNISEPAVYSFVAKDTIAPPAPGGFGASITGETAEKTSPLHSAEAHHHRDGNEGEGQLLAPELPGSEEEKPESHKKGKPEDGDPKHQLED